MTEAIYDAGFNSNSRFYEKSDAMLGMTPTAWRAGGADADIRFSVGECSLGSILVAMSGKGVCAILLGDDPDALLRHLQDRFPRAKLIGGDPEFEELVAKVVGFVEAPASASIYRWMCAAPLFSSGSGRRCAKFRPARQRATPRSPSGSARRSRCGLWRPPVRPTFWLWRSPVTASSGMMARCRAIAGVSIASAPCSSEASAA